MKSDRDQQRINAAVELGFLNQSQLESIATAQKESSFPATEIAIQLGFLGRKQLQVLDIFAKPLSVVPGYRIDGLIGQGGVGTVFKATQLRMARPVAIKIISQAASRNDLIPRRFEREAQIVGKLRHPNIVSAIDFGVHQDQLYLVMEFVEGVDGEKHLREKTSIPELHAWIIAKQVCHALDNANQMGITHRDIKPGNLILTQSPAGSQFPADIPFVKIADFGLAKFKQNPADSKITLDHSISGTPYYMSPEQVQSTDVDHRSDVYSLGMTVWHLITGRPPITGSGPLDVISKKMKLEDDWIVDDNRISKAGLELLGKMCRHDRQQRVSDYAELDALIGQVIEDFDSEIEPVDSNLDAIDVEPFSAVTQVLRVHDTFALDYAASLDHQTADFEKPATRSAPDEIAEPASAKRVSRKKVLVAALCAAVIIPLLVIFWRVSPAGDWAMYANTSAKKPAEFETELTEFDGLPQFLFDGLNMDPTQQSSGIWDVGKGPEGESVLAGKNGARKFRCRDVQREPLRYYQFECGFRHHQAESIQFSVNQEKGEAEEAQPSFSVKISADAAALEVGDQELARSEVKKFDDQSFGYHLIRISAQPDHWQVELDSKLLGQVPRPENFADPGFIELSVEGKGDAHFEQIRFRKFKF